MGLINVKAKIDGKEVERGFNRMMSSTAKIRAFYSAMKKPAKQDVREHGEQQRGPSGGWPSRDSAYMGRRRKRRRKKKVGDGQKVSKRNQFPRRRVLGRLPRAISTKVTRGGLFLYSRITWGGIHNAGGTAGKGATIPPRPFLWFSQPVMRFASKQYANFVVQHWPAGTKLKVKKR